MANELAAVLTGVAEGAVRGKRREEEIALREEQTTLQRERLALSERQVTTGEAAESRLLEAQRAATGFAGRQVTLAESVERRRVQKAEAEAKRKTGIAESNAQLKRSVATRDTVNDYENFIKIPFNSAKRGEARDGIREEVRSHSNSKFKFDLMTSGNHDLITEENLETGEVNILGPDQIAQKAHQAKKDRKEALFDLIRIPKSEGGLSLAEADAIESGQLPAEARVEAEEEEDIEQDRDQALVALANADIDPEEEGITLNPNERLRVKGLRVKAKERIDRFNLAMDKAEAGREITETEALSITRALNTEVLKFKFPRKEDETEGEWVVRLDRKRRLFKGLDRAEFRSHTRDFKTGALKPRKAGEDLSDAGRLSEDFVFTIKGKPKSKGLTEAEELLLP